MENNIANSIKHNLAHFTAIELRQKEAGAYVPDIPFSSTRVINNQLELLNNYFFKKQSIYISKHNRFAAYPLHSHQFTELNYMLSGSCRQIIDGQHITLGEGDLLLIGTGASHEIKTMSEGDLLINILFNEQAINVEWLNQMKDNHSPIIRYLCNTILSKGNTATHLLFQTSEFQEIQKILKEMIHEYFSAKSYSSTISGLYLPILFTALARNFDQLETSLLERPDLSRQDEKIIPVFHLIEENFKTINLTKAAELLNYNKTYLGQLIKKSVGVPFTQLVIKRRLYQARLLLNTTDLSISDIAQESGFSNKTYFYKVFKEEFGYLPGDERKHPNSP